MSGLILPFINLGVLIGILVYYTRKPLKSFVQSRHHTILSELKEAQDQLHRAQEQYEEFSAKLKAIGAEISAFRDQTRQEATQARARISADAKRVSAAVVTEARATAEGLVTELRGQLHAELMAGVISRAEKLIVARLTREDRVRIHQEFSKEIGGAP
ncbi:MAG TPA: ATP synthase F0 subunit B [Bdellovibrionota bacterium]|nr:ATP synthase F0 subunit B [Bdellovibrionota bacterium]